MDNNSTYNYRDELAEDLDDEVDLQDFVEEFKEDEQDDDKMGQRRSHRWDIRRPPQYFHDQDEYMYMNVGGYDEAEETEPIVHKEGEAPVME